MSGGYLRYQPPQMRRLPVRVPDSGVPDQDVRCSRMELLVGHMQELHEKLAQAKTPQARRLLQQQVEVTDGEIDRLVYELYELTEEEIAIVEASKT